MHMKNTIPLARSRPTDPVLAVAPILLVAATMAATWLLSGVAADEAARFLAFEVLYVLLPGCMLYVLLSPAPGGWFRVLAIGWPCGYAIEVGAFALTAALHVRELFALLPLAAVAVAAPFLMRARGRERLDALSRGLRDRSNFPWRGERRVEAMAVAVALSAALVLLALMIFASDPLPAHMHSVFYNPDNTDDISWAAEALHHWPITLPWVAGLPAHYYTAVFIHFAAVRQVTGVPLSTLVLRLFPTMAIVVSALQLWFLSRTLGRSPWIAPITLALLLIVGALNLDATRAGGPGVEIFAGSPTYALGVIFFLGLLALAQAWFTDIDTVAAPRRGPWAGSLPRGSLGLLILLCVLVLGGGASKTSAIADFIVGLGVLWLWRLVRGGSGRLLSCGLVISAGCSLAVYVFMLRGGNVSTLHLHPLEFIHYSVFGPTFTAPSGSTWPVLTGHSFIWFVGLLVAAAATLLCVLVPLLGAGWLLVRPRAISPFALFAYIIFAVSVLAVSTLSAPGGSEGYFLTYGYLALAPVAARGLVGLWEATPLQARRRVILVCAAVLAVGLAAGGSSRAMSGAARAAWYVWYVVAYGVLACVIVIAVLNLRRSITTATRSRVAGIFASGVLVLITLGMVQPLIQVTPRVWSTIFHERISLADARDHQGMTKTLYDGLIWVRDHTKPCDVLAVNNHYTFAPSHKSGVLAVDLFSHYPYYTAFTERRVLIESWYSTPLGLISNDPYPARRTLNDLAVVHGSTAYLRELARGGISYVLVDKTHGGGAAESASVSRLVFENSALRVYRLLAPPRAVAGVGRACGTVTGI
jgi:hypothetical protein